MMVRINFSELAKKVSVPVGDEHYQVVCDKLHVPPIFVQVGTRKKHRLRLYNAARNRIGRYIEVRRPDTSKGQIFIHRDDVGPLEKGISELDAAARALEALETAARQEVRKRPAPAAPVPLAPAFVPAKKTAPPKQITFAEASFGEQLGLIMDQVATITAQVKELTATTKRIEEAMRWTKR
jgi:hypothetical protein